MLEANGEYDAGRVWATRTFRMRKAGKSSLYRHEVGHAAIDAMLEAVDRVLIATTSPETAPQPSGVATGPCLPLMTQEVRAIDWQSDRMDHVLRKIRAGEGSPGVLDTIHGQPFHLFGAHPERMLRGQPGELIAQRDGAICRATIDGAVWITHLKRQDAPPRSYFKLPATRALALARIRLALPEVRIGLDAQIPDGDTYRETSYHEDAGVGYLGRSLLVESAGDRRSRPGHRANRVAPGGLGARRRRRGRRRAARAGGRLRSRARGHRPQPSLPAHGRPLRIGVLDLPASETRRRGNTNRLTEAPFDPIGTREAVRIGLLDAAFGSDVKDFREGTERLAGRLSRDGLYPARLKEKRLRRALDERAKPLEAYRRQELTRCRHCFFGSDSGYHEARRRFVHKLSAHEAPAEQPARLAV